MRVLFTTFPGFGHFHPLVPLAFAALARDDEVLVATGPELGAWVQSCGLEFRRAGRSSSETFAEAAERFPGPAVVNHGFATVAVPAMARDLLDLVGNWRPDLIVHEQGELAAPLVSALLDVPCITQSYAAPARPEDVQGLYRDLLDPIWADHGAGPPKLSGEVYLDACPPAFQSDSLRSIPGVRPIRPVAFDGPATSAPPWVAQLKHPAAYISFGTAPAFSRPEVLQGAMDSLAGVVASTVVTTGPNPVDVFTLPSPSVHVQEYLAQSIVLPHVDVVVSHGGAGTTLGALLHGLPHVVVPQQRYRASQLRNAERVEELGLGIAVKQAELSETIADAVREVLGNASYRENSLAMSKTLRELPSPDDVWSDLTFDPR